MSKFFLKQNKVGKKLTTNALKSNILNTKKKKECPSLEKLTMSMKKKRGKDRNS
jgi:hypothetical protein